MKTARRLSTLLFLSTAAAAFAHDAGIPHAHPHVEGGDSNTILIVGLASLCLIGAFFFARRSKQAGNR